VHEVKTCFLTCDNLCNRSYQFNKDYHIAKSDNEFIFLHMHYTWRLLLQKGFNAICQWLQEMVATRWRTNQCDIDKMPFGTKEHITTESRRQNSWVSVGI